METVSHGLEAAVLKNVMMETITILTLVLIIAWMLLVEILSSEKEWKNVMMETFRIRMDALHIAKLRLLQFKTHFVETLSNKRMKSVMMEILLTEMDVAQIVKMKVAFLVELLLVLWSEL